MSATDKQRPMIIPEEVWANTTLSVVRHYGSITYNQVVYVIVDKCGRDIFELSEIAKREGKANAIEPEEPCDLCRMDMIPAYRKLGREAMIDLIREGLTDEDIKNRAYPDRTNHTLQA